MNIQRKTIEKKSVQRWKIIWTSNYDLNDADRTHVHNLHIVRTPVLIISKTLKKWSSDNNIRENIQDFTWCSIFISASKIHHIISIIINEEYQMTLIFIQYFFCRNDYSYRVADVVHDSTCNDKFSGSRILILYLLYDLSSRRPQWQRLDKFYPGKT